MASKRFRDAVGIDPDRVVSAAVDAALGSGQSRGKTKKHHPGRVLAAGAAVAAAAAVGQRRMPRLVKAPLKMGMHKIGHKLGDMAHVDGLADAVRNRLVGHDDEPEDEYYDDEEFDDEEFEDEGDFDDEDDLDDEDDEGFDDEPEDDGPRGEGDDEEPDDEEPDDEDSEDEDSEDEEPDDEEPDDEEPEDEEPEDEEPEDEDDEPIEDDEPEEEGERIAARSLELGIPDESKGHRGRGHVPDLFEALLTPPRAPVMRRKLLRVDPATRPPEPDESESRERPRNRKRGSSKSKSKAARA